MNDNGDEEDTIVNLQSRESVDWLRATRDEDEDKDCEADTDGQE